MHTNYSVDSLVRHVFVGEGQQLIVENVNYKGASKSIAYFENKLKYNDLLNEGIILSTGDVHNAIGPNTVPDKGNEVRIYTNNDPSKGYKIGGYSDADLKKLVHNDVFDAAILQFDFVSFTDSISFSFFFASEEYPEYVNKSVNDVFAFYLIDYSTGIKRNIALLPNKTPISIDRINAEFNSNYHIQNKHWNKEKGFVQYSSKQQNELAYVLQFDGMSEVLHVGAKVKPFKKYRLKMAIADVGDSYFDSAVFLKANSLKSKGEDQPIPTLFILNQIDNSFSDHVTNKTDTSITVSFQVNFDFDVTQVTNKKDQQNLNKVLELLKKFPALSVHIIGHTDTKGSENYNLTLSEERAESVAKFLSNNGINLLRIQTKGVGYSDQLNPDQDWENRRVEFTFYY